MQLIRDAHQGAYTVCVKELFFEYSRWIEASLGVSLSFQGFEREMAEFPGLYAPPQGRLALATLSGKPAGCVALRPVTEQVCEMKRLYVRPAFRGHRLGERLILALVEEALAIGYARIVLDTLHPGMETAVRMYRSLGFEEIEPYHEVPKELRGRMIFMGLDLKRWSFHN